MSIDRENTETAAAYPPEVYMELDPKSIDINEVAELLGCDSAQLLRIADLKPGESVIYTGSAIIPNESKCPNGDEREESSVFSEEVDEGMTLSAEDVVTALDCCGHMRNCESCPLGSMGGPEYCMHKLLKNALDLIELKDEAIGLLEKKIESAYTDFAARLKEKAEVEYFTDIDPVLGSIECEYRTVDVEDIDDVLNEMIGTKERE